MSIERRLTQAEKAAAVTATNESHTGELIIHDGETGEVLHRRRLPGNVSVLLPDNGRDPAIRDGRPTCGSAEPSSTRK